MQGPVIVRKNFQSEKEGLNFIVIASLVAKLFKILIYANQITCEVTKLCIMTKYGIFSQIPSLLG